MGFALSHSRRQRIHIESGMFSSALVDFTIVITDSMVPELAEAGGLLDSAGPALSDGHDIRIAADANGDVALPIDLRGFSQAADPANGGIEFATKIPLTDPVAGNDIYLFYGDDDAPAVLPTDPLGQYEAYDDDTIFYAPVGGGANRTAFNITGTDVGGITAGDIAAPSGLLGTQHTDVGDYSTYGDNPDLDLVNTDWTVSFLFRATTSGLEQYILGKYNHTTQDRGYLCIFSGSQHFDLTYQPVRTSYNPIYRLSSGVDVVDGQWHHLAGTFISGTQASVYTEGILRNTTTNNIPFSVASNNASFQIGTQITAQNEPADFSQVKVHSVARSAEWLKAETNNFLSGSSHITGYSSEATYQPVSNMFSQRIHINAGMFASGLTDWTLVVTEQMVPELKQDNWLLDPTGVTQSNLADMRIYLDNELLNEAPLDLRRYVKDASQANRVLEFATKIPLTDAVAGNDIWIGAGDPTAEAPAADGLYGQYNTYDDNYFLISPCGCGLDRSRNQWATTNNGGLTPGDAVTPWGLGTIFDGNASQQYLSFDDIAEWNALLEVDQPNSCEVLARNDNTASGLPQFIAAKIAEAVSYQGWNFLYHAGINELTVNNNYGTGSAIGRAATFTMVQSTWYHLATTYSGNNNASGFLIYSNGVNLTTSDKTTGTGSTNQHSYPFLVGARGWGKPNSQREWDGVLDELRMSSVARSADWIASNHANFMQGDTLLVGYDYFPNIGDLIPYSGNESSYEAFIAAGGGYFQGDGNAFFRLGQEKVIDVTQPFEIEFKAFYNASYVEDFNGLFSPKAGSPGRIIIQNSNRRIYPHGANLPSAVYLGSLIDDANWHTYKIVGDGVDVSFIRDGSTERSVGIASYDGGFKYDSLLVNTNEEHPWEHNIAYLSVTKNGVLTHRWDFCHANAAGNDGPDYVLDRVGGVHGVSSSDVSSNWKRNAALTDALLDGFNLYENAVVPAVPNYGRVDALGVALEYYAHIATGDALYTPINEGGFFKGGNDAYFDLGQSLAVPATVDVSIRFKYRKAASAFFAILGNGIYNSEAVEVDFTGNLQFRAPTGGGSTQVVAMNAKADSLWHEYQIDYNQATNTISTYKDGSPVTLDHVANFNGGVWDWSFLLRRTTTSQVFVDEIAFIEISIDGVVEHYFDFGLANAAGDAGPDAVWDLVGGVNGVGVNTGNSNWGRTANLPNNLPNGYNLYYREPGVVWPATIADDTIDPFGVAIQYDNAVTGQSINGELFENASIFYDGSVNPGNVSISGQLHTNPQTFYNGLLTPGNVIISGQLFTNTSIFYNNIIDSGSTVIYGNVYTNTPTFYSGSIETGNVNISGGLHTNVSTFFDNEVRPSNYNISGNVYVNPQTFYSGSITGGEAVINGGLYTNPQTFYEGVISTSGVVVSGELFANSPVFFNNEFTLGNAVVNGELFTNVNVFYNNAIIQGLSILGELFINTNVFYPSLVFPESDHIDGELFENASIFYANEIALAPEDFIEIHIALSAKPFASIDFTARQGVRFEDGSSPQTVNGVLFINSQTFYIGEIEWL
jgi:hypothetical protein